MTQDSAGRTAKSRFWNPPEWDRLDGAIKDAEITLAQYGAEAQKEEWWPTADQHLKQARDYLAAGNHHQGWISQQSALRAMLLNRRRSQAGAQKQSRT
jgi:hypothetical protein